MAESIERPYVEIVLEEVENLAHTQVEVKYDHHHFLLQPGEKRRVDYEIGVSPKDVQFLKEPARRSPVPYRFDISNSLSQLIITESISGGNDFLDILKLYGTFNVFTGDFGICIEDTTFPPWDLAYHGVSTRYYYVLIPDEHMVIIPSNDGPRDYVGWNRPE